MNQVDNNKEKKRTRLLTTCPSSRSGKGMKNVKAKSIITISMAILTTVCASGSALDVIKSSCRRQLGCCDERIHEVVRFSEALVGKCDVAEQAEVE